MRSFVFRAEVALRVRRKEEEAAQADLSRAHARVHEALGAHDRAQVALDDAVRRCVESDARARGVETAMWYRNWIDGLRRVLREAGALLAAADVDRQQALQRAHAARQRVRVLERLEARARAAYELGLRREEQRAIDELAGLQYVIRQRGDQE